jgi:hypothetical protein
MTKTWRKRYKVHPCADVFPMMTDEELDKLAEDIKANGLKDPVDFVGDELVDGRNRMEAMERGACLISCRSSDYQMTQTLRPASSVRT